MGKTRIVNLAKELKMEVRELIQRLKDDLGLQENFTYLSSLDEPVTLSDLHGTNQSLLAELKTTRPGNTSARRPASFSRLVTSAISSLIQLIPFGRPS
jgi:hypothetical protein